MLPTVAFAGTYKGQCLNKVEKDMDGCNVVIENGSVSLIMKSSSNETGNQTISGNSIKKIEQSKSAKRLSKTALWSTIALGPIGLLALAFKKKTMSYVVAYESNGKTEGAIFVIKRSQSPLADIDFNNLGHKVVNVDTMSN
jgi:hypothetical protein